MSPPPPSAKWNAIKLAPDDTVATALSALDPDTTPRISGGEAGQAPRVVEPIPRGHKFALADIAAPQHRDDLRAAARAIAAKLGLSRLVPTKRLP